MTDDTNLPSPEPGSRSLPPGGSSGPPAWLVPVLVAAIVALAAVLLVVVFTGDDDSPSTDATTQPADTGPGDTTPDTEPPTTGDTTPDTEPPSTGDTTPDTEPPTTEPPATLPPDPDAPLAADVGTLSPGQMSIAGDFGTLTLDTAQRCTTSVTVGLQVASAVATDDDGSVFVVDVVSDEGVEPFLTVTDLGGQIAGFFFGQDGPGAIQWSGGPVDPSGTTNQVTLEAIGFGNAASPINVSIDPADDGDCSTGFLSENWTFTDGQTPEVLDPTDPDVLGRRFAVLAECAGGLVLSEGGTLSSSDLDGAVSADVEFPTVDGTFDAWSSPDPPGPNDSFVDQQGGGGDLTVVARVVDFETGSSGNLTWTERPTVDGGLVSIDCGA